ncbi:MAG: phytanoyl-CoA dioxygenase family protein, partial [Gammaproteobacteria bacterium]|nr:phytanoyl-CoA dioxygenase family protein [Gammaproteobacteria bacterium]MBT7538558.1 phytanoyl-CoA dioxygenase family protein [Gammaproteobacteria bacterium]
MTNQLNQTQIEQYHRDGFLVLEEFLSPTWLERLRQTTEAFVEESRKVERSDKVFDVEPDHTNDNPRLRRLNNPSDQDETYWEFSSQSEIVDLAEDILGPDIKFHHSKLNFKFPHGGEEVKWHQDIQFWPHTNYDLITIGV